ncbi:MAG: hypothetical protein V1844_07730 [Pseudomonadota bacterium]
MSEPARNEDKNVATGDHIGALVHLLKSVVHLLREHAIDRMLSEGQRGREILNLGD